MLVPQERTLAAESLAMMAHWRCQVWSEMSRDDTSSLAHFEQGYTSGSRFVAAARAGQIEEVDFDETVPVYISMSLAGPSDDFVLGRLYEMTMTQAYDQIVRRGKDGALLNPSDYVMDLEVQAVLAEGLIRSSNCAALRRP
jgi:hypothetical protein